MISETSIETTLAFNRYFVACSLKLPFLKSNVVCGPLDVGDTIYSMCCAGWSKDGATTLANVFLDKSDDLQPCFKFKLLGRVARLYITPDTATVINVFDYIKNGLIEVNQNYLDHYEWDGKKILVSPMIWDKLNSTTDLKNG